jgi:hypothetical protein
MICVSPVVTKKLKFCIDCSEFFVEHKEYKCKLFYNVDVITGRRSYYSCNTAEQNASLCGEDARFFFPNSSFGRIAEYRHHQTKQLRSSFQLQTFMNVVVVQEVWQCHTSCQAF